MDFALTEEQLLLRRTVREFAEKEIAPFAEELDETEEFHYDLVPKIAELGIFGLIFPEKYGGSGADTVTYTLAVEELARVDSSVAATVSAHVTLASNLIYQYGTEEQRQKWLVPLIRGEMLGAFGLTEPGAGSDAGATATKAVLDGGEWVINGCKCFITNAGTDITGLAVITAATGTRPDGRKAINAIVVPRGTPGFRQGKRYKKMGWRSSDTRELIFEDCRVPRENLLGEEGKGFRQVLEGLDLGRVSIAALGVGLGQGCLDMSLKYARERVQFGQPLARFQVIQFKIADMATKVELARLATHRAAWLRDSGLPFAKEAAMAKLFSSEMANDLARQAVQIHGGYGFINEYPVSRFYRDAKILEIGEGTSEVQRMVIARSLGC